MAMAARDCRVLDQVGDEADQREALSEGPHPVCCGLRDLRAAFGRLVEQGARILGKAVRLGVRIGARTARVGFAAPAAVFVSGGGNILANWD